MTDQVNEKSDENKDENEMTLLKDRAGIMGIKYSPNIGLDTLRERVNAALVSGMYKKDTSKKEEQPAETIAERNTRFRREANRLIRIRLTCMDPNKKNWPGEIFTVSNAVIGTVKKFVPFNADQGYHVPHVIYEQLKARKYQEFRKVTVAGGRKVMKSFLSKTFAIELLDPLTPKELKDLADRQALNHSIDQ